MFTLRFFHSYRILFVVLFPGDYSCCPYVRRPPSFFSSEQKHMGPAVGVESEFTNELFSFTHHVLSNHSQNVGGLWLLSTTEVMFSKCFCYLTDCPNPNAIHLTVKYDTEMPTCHSWWLNNHFMDWLVTKIENETFSANQHVLSSLHCGQTNVQK